jgi:hypothetical protein
MTATGQPPASTTDRDKPAARAVAVKLDPWQRVVALILMALTLGFGAYLAYRNNNGVGTAAVFAVALIMLIAGFGGVLPTSLKVGDVEVAIDEARMQGPAAVETWRRLPTHKRPPSKLSSSSTLS